MTSAENPDPDDAQAATWREVRLALVLYGGVSMAIYMYGVVYEIWRLVRASKALERGLADEKNPWTTVLRRSKRRVTVDVVSGTSAGGINGILLGRALASGGDLATAEDVWLEKADFDELLTREGDDPASLLRSGFFEDELGKALRKMGTDPSRRLVDVLDVFAGTTHLGGDRREFFDRLGHKLTTKRHDVPVRLRYRNQERFAAALGLAGEEGPGDVSANDFDNDQLLVQVARATSAFPFAFEPVTRTHDQHGSTEWPAGHYTDGGVVNNKPFEQALDAIFGRAAELPVSRWILSVDPDPEAPASRPASEPDFLDIVAAATFSIPRYESIQGDLDRLYEHRKKVAIYWDGALDGLEPAVAAGTVNWVTDLQYAALRRAALTSFLVEEYRRARQNSPLMQGRTTWFDDFRQIAEKLPLSDDEIPAIDVAFELRRAYYVIKLVGRMADDGEIEEDALIAARQEMWRRFEAARNAAWEAVRAMVPAGSGALRVDALKVAIEPRAGRISGLSVIAPAEAAFAEFEARDRALLSVDAFGFRTPRDEVNHAAITPTAAHALDQDVPPDERLAGDTLAHFGGFLDRRWRENDILWGRLDSADILVKSLGSDAGLGDGAVTELTASVQCDVVVDLLEAEPGRWKQALVASNPAGGEGIGDIPGSRLSGLALRSGRVAERMFGSLSTSGRQPLAALLRFILKPIGSAIARALTPLIFLIALAIGKGAVKVRLGAAAALLPAIAGTIISLSDVGWDNRKEVGIFVLGWAISIAWGNSKARGR